MGKYKLIVLTEPKEGCEAEYNTWYNHQHLPEVVAVPGFGSAQRFKLEEVCGGEFKQRYLAIYEIDAADYSPAIKELLHRAATGVMELSQTLNADKTAFAVFAECSPRVDPPKSR